MRADPVTDALRPYASYLESAVPWLGDVPSHWKILPGRACYGEKQVRNVGLRETRVLSLSYGHIVIKPEDALHGLVPESFETYQIVEPGDIIVRPTDLQNDQNSLRFGSSPYRGIITSAYMCLETRDPHLPEFGYLLLNAYDLKKIFYGLGSGLRQNLDWGDFKYLPCPVPPLPEQAAIVRFLDHADRRIQRYIRAKKKLIALLNEQKQAIIHHAVTRGLDPNVCLKPSGVEWLGDVPEHWKVQRVRDLVRRIDQGVSPQAEAMLAEDGSWGVLKAGCVNGGVFRDTEHKRLPTDFNFDESLAVQVGDVLVSRASGSLRLVGSVGRVETMKYRLILSDKTFRLVVRDERIADFLVAAMNTHYFRIQVEQAISGAEGLANNLPLSELRTLRVAVPPSDEAQAVAAEIGIQTEGIERLMRRAEREIALLIEYRTRLIADVVTGKFDVREAAANLPDDEFISGPLDVLDHLVETDEEIEEADLEAEALPA